MEGQELVLSVKDLVKKACESQCSCQWLTVNVANMRSGTASEFVAHLVGDLSTYEGPVSICGSKPNGAQTVSPARLPIAVSASLVSSQDLCILVVKMTSDKSTPASMSLLILTVSSKLQGQEEYLKWRRIMQDYLKIPDLRTYIDGQPAELVRALETKVVAWRARYDKPSLPSALQLMRTLTATLKILQMSRKPGKL